MAGETLYRCECETKSKVLETDFQNRKSQVVEKNILTERKHL